MNRIRMGLAIAAAAVAVSLAACGGGGGNDDAGGGGGTAGSQIPASAQQSSEGLIAFMRELISSFTADTSEPFVLGDAVLPTSETLEPLPVR